MAFVVSRIWAVLIFCCLSGAASCCVAQGDARPAENSSAGKAVRLWTDSTGNFRIQAALVSQDARSVRLRKEDGVEIVVPKDRLSGKDAAFLAGLAAAAPRSTLPRLIDITTAEHLERAATETRNAEQALTLYRLFLADPNVAELEKQRAADRVKHWESAAEKQAERIGSKWYPREEIVAMRLQEASLYVEAMRLWELGNFELASKKFDQASRANPGSVRSDFKLGILHAILARDVKTGAKHFSKCVNARSREAEQLNSLETANLIASLNNLALTSVREGKLTTALGYWQRAIEAGPPAQEIGHNLSRLSQLAASPAHGAAGAATGIHVSSSEKRRLEDMYTRVVTQLSGEVLAPGTGWLYMAWIPEVRDASGPSDDVRVAAPAASDVADDDRLRIVGYGTGFVVAPGYVLTNSHVTENADAFHLVQRDAPNERLLGKAAVVSDRDDLDLALIRCEDLTASPLEFADQPPRLGAELRLLGFPLPDELGTSLKATRGTIAALPPHEGMRGALADYKDYYLYDALINPGNSGGPACDATGHVVAVNAAILLPQAAGGGYAAGVPSAQALEFVRANIADYRAGPQPQAAGAGSWETAIDVVGASTVQILILQTPEKISLGDNFQDARRVKRDWDAYEDPWCMVCHGRGKVLCAARNCRSGTVGSFRQETQRFPDGATIMRKVPIRVPCTACRGAGYVDCRACQSGIDPVFFQ